MALGAAQRPPHAQGHERHVAERDTSAERGGYEGAERAVRVPPLFIGHARVGRSCTVGLAADSVRESLIRRVLGGTGIHSMFGTGCIQLLLDSVSLLNMSGDLRVLTATSLPSGHTPVLASPCISHATATHTASHHTHCRTSDLLAEYICYGAVC